MIVVFFKPLPDDPDSGPILRCTEMSADLIAEMEMPYVKVDEFRADWDFTHEVKARATVARDPAVLADLRLKPAQMRLRVQRRALLIDNYDAIRTNPARWDALTPAQQEAFEAYRLALLDWPATERDLLNPTPPVPPEI